MSRMTDYDREIIAEELLKEAEYRRYDRRWYNHWQMLKIFPQRTRSIILDIEALVIGIPVLIVWGYIVYRLLVH